VFGTSSVDSNVAILNAAAQDATEQPISRGIIKPKSKFPQCHSGFLKHLGKIIIL
jgi:hypothetical protein